MMESPTFEWLSATLEERTAMNRLTARGTVRVALRKSGLKPESVNAGEMAHVLRFNLAKELGQRGVSEADHLCQELLSQLKTVKLATAEPAYQAPEDIFRRVFTAS